MATVIVRPEATSGPLVDPQLASLLERQDQVAAAAPFYEGPRRG